MPEEARNQVTAGSEDGSIKYPHGFDFVGYLLHRMDAMENNLRAEIKTEVQSLRAENRSFIRWAIGIFITLVVGFASVIVTIWQLR